MFSIYELTPAPWGDHYRYVQGFERREEAEEVLKVLEKVTAYNFNLYRIVDMNEPKGTERLDGKKD
jgi:hypothetical protein